MVRSLLGDVRGNPNAHVVFVGHSQGGMTAGQIAASNGSDTSQTFVVDDVVTAGAPTAQIPDIPRRVGEPNPDAINRAAVRFYAPTGSIAGNHWIEQYQAGRKRC